MWCIHGEGNIILFILFFDDEHTIQPSGPDSLRIENIYVGVHASIKPITACANVQCVSPPLKAIQYAEFIWICWCWCSILQLRISRIFFSLCIQKHENMLISMWICMCKVIYTMIESEDHCFVQSWWWNLLDFFLTSNNNNNKNEKKKWWET